MFGLDPIKETIDSAQPSLKIRRFEELSSIKLAHGHIVFWFTTRADILISLNGDKFRGSELENFGNFGFASRKSK